jgi:hypothetical protein
MQSIACTHPDPQRRRLTFPVFTELQTHSLQDIVQRKAKYVQADVRLVCSMQVDEDVDARDNDFGENEYDDNPFE